MKRVLADLVHLFFHSSLLLDAGVVRTRNLTSG